MTVPVLSRMKLLADGMVNKQMCFYLNKKHQANPPTPTDPAVKIEQNKEFTVYVHNFGGYAMCGFGVVQAVHGDGLFSVLRHRAASAPHFQLPELRRQLVLVSHVVNGPV